MVALISELATLEAQASADLDSAYVRLTVEVATGQLTDAETIHASLRALGRDSAQLQSDLAHYAAVHSDFDLFAQLGQRQLDHAAAQQNEREAEHHLVVAANLTHSAQRALEAAERERTTSQLVTHRAAAAVTDAQCAADRLMQDPTRLRFLPQSFRLLMIAVTQLRSQRDAADLQIGTLREQIGEARQRIADFEQQIRYARSRDYWSCPGLDTGDIKKRIAADKQNAANWQTAADNQTRLIVQWDAELIGVSAIREQRNIELEHARAKLSAALVHPNSK